MATNNILKIGTSGWSYPRWEDKFYPGDWPKAPDRKLEYYAQEFNTAEVNYSFYRIPAKKTYLKWQEKTPPKFTFAVKASRFITHVKQLKSVKTPWRKFMQPALTLGGKLGPILIQLPSSFKASRENISRVNKTLIFLNQLVDKRKVKLKLALETRDDSWFEKEPESVFKKHNASLVISHSSVYPYTEKTTADFIYIRLHGPTKLYSSRYSETQLEEWGKKIKKWQQAGKEIYVYFNNDFNAYAAKNAKQLLGIINTSN